jgi:predicted RNA methylase
MGDKGFDPDFNKKTKIEQLNIALDSSTITGKAPLKEFYESKAEEFFKNTNLLMNQSPYKAVREFVNKYQLTPKMLELIYQSKTDGDFFPTGKSCINNMMDKMSWWLKLDNGTFKMLEGTSGIGQVGYYFKQRYPDSNITLNELSPNNLAISKLFLNNDDFKFSNKNFFDITNKDYDLIFLNPPFGSNDHFYLKFLLHALYLLNQTFGNKMVFFISPSLGWDKKITGPKETEVLSNDFTSIFDFVSPNRAGDRPRIPPKALVKWINELNKTDYTVKDLEKAKEARNEDIKINKKQQELLDLIEDDYNFIIGQGIGECTDFGGTKFNANMYYFQVLRQGTGSGKPMKLVKTGSGYKCCCK